jgi:hypothetical protein
MEDSTPQEIGPETSETLSKALQTEWWRIEAEVAGDPGKSWKLENPEWNFARVLKGFPIDLDSILVWLKQSDFAEYADGIAERWDEIEYPKAPLEYFSSFARDDFSHPDLKLVFDGPSSVRKLAHLFILLQKYRWKNSWFPLCQEEIGMAIGMEQPTVSKKIRTLVKIGWLVLCPEREEGHCQKYYVPAALNEF